MVTLIMFRLIILILSLITLSSCRPSEYNGLFTPPVIKYGGWKPIIAPRNYAVIAQRSHRVLTVPEWTTVPSYRVDRFWKSPGFVPVISGGIDYAPIHIPHQSLHPHFQEGIGDNGPFIENGHLSPDFSNGLEYPDPYLLHGQQAANAVKYLYGHELYFHNIPHVRALLHNQKMRRENGLEGNRLSSSRYNSPFFRDF